MDYMRVALDGLPDQEPSMPEGIVTVRIDPRTGRRVAAGSEGAFFEIFRSENAPGENSGGGSISAPGVTPLPTQELF